MLSEKKRVVVGKSLLSLSSQHLSCRRMGQIWFAAESDKYGKEYLRNTACKVFVVGPEERGGGQVSSPLPLSTSQLQPNQRHSQSQSPPPFATKISTDTPKFCSNEFDSFHFQSSFTSRNTRFRTRILNSCSYSGFVGPESTLKIDFWFCSEIM